MNVKNISANIAYIAPEDTILKVDCTGGASAIYFAEPSINYSGVFTVKKIDSGANAVTIYPYSGETIDSSASVTLTNQNAYKTFAPVTGGFTVIDSDSGLTVTTTGTQTLTNKTLTSPKINENVAVTATSTEVNLLDGIHIIGQMAEADISYTDSATALFTIPDGAKIYSMTVYATTGFNGTSPTYDVGYAANPDAILDGITLPATAGLASGAYAVTATVNEWVNGVTSGVLIGTFAGGGSNTAGAGKIRIAYYV